MALWLLPVAEAHYDYDLCLHEKSHEKGIKAKHGWEIVKFINEIGGL
ncbi:MAG: hypothetical protein KKA54_16715 [Proteobacteria bacterium]|nr:hypothetical protein [Pseudomonadota bacterium]